MINLEKHTPALVRRDRLPRSKLFVSPDRIWARVAVVLITMSFGSTILYRAYVVTPDGSVKGIIIF